MSVFIYSMNNPKHQKTASLLLAHTYDVYLSIEVTNSLSFKRMEGVVMVFASGALIGIGSRSV
jgi:hypothetical protein